MKVYEKIGGAYIQIHNKKMEQSGFTEGVEFDVSYSPNRIVLEVKR